VIDDEARTTSRSETRVPCPVDSVCSKYTSFIANCKEYSYSRTLGMLVQKVLSSIYLGSYHLAYYYQVM